MRAVLISFAAFFLLVPSVFAADTPQSYVTTELAQVIAITESEQRPIPGTETLGTFQTVRAELMEGSAKGSIVTVLNDYLTLKVGDKFYVRHTVDSLLGVDTYDVSEAYRLDGLAVLFGLFILAVVLIGGWRGIRGVVALAMSLFFIGYLLLPGILHGLPPLPTAFGVASLIIVLGSYITHGFNRVTTSAVFGMITTVGAAALLAHFAILITHLSGFTSEESVYLNFDTAGRIDFAGLLLGGMLIGILGVLYDAAIGQSVAVDELAKSAPTASRRELFSRAMRIGREHIGALVNTLAIAYVGVSLPLLLLFYSINSDASLLTTLNREIFAEEVVRVLVGSIGIMLTVPLTTGIAVFMLVDRKKPS